MRQCADAKIGTDRWDYRRYRGSTGDAQRRRLASGQCSRALFVLFARDEAVYHFVAGRSGYLYVPSPSLSLSLRV
jgi:hypothetical protein